MKKNNISIIIYIFIYMNDYYSKYCFYKNKYLNLKKQDIDYITYDYFNEIKKNVQFYYYLKNNDIYFVKIMLKKEQILKIFRNQNYILLCISISKKIYDKRKITLFNWFILLVQTIYSHYSNKDIHYEIMKKVRMNGYLENSDLEYVITNFSRKEILIIFDIQNYMLRCFCINNKLYK